MSSWLPSIFNSDDNPSPESSSAASPSASVKEDLDTLFRGVAAFLAPPPSPSPPPPPNSSSTSSSRVISGIKNDLAELEGSFKSSLSLLSSKFSSNLLQFQRETNDSDYDSKLEEEEEEDCVVGITEEVVEFVSKISLRPELWTDFPILLPDDFVMSEYQREHAAEIEHLVSSLVNLRQRISSQISHGKFWMIYFILLFPRFNEEDLNLLATPEIVEMRDILLDKLQNKSNAAQETIENSKTDEEHVGKDEEESRKHNMPNEAVGATTGTSVVGDSDSDHRYLNDHKNEDEFSFSDLEDDKNDLSRFKSSQIKEVGSPNKPKEWVELNGSSEDDQRRKWLSSGRDKGSESDESSDWFTVSNSDL